MSKTSLFVLSLLLSCFSFSQLESKNAFDYKGVPTDLNTNKIIFVLLDSAILEKEEPKKHKDGITWQVKKMHNSKMGKSNEELVTSALLYPFDYIITKRNKIDEFRQKGYKYLLDFKPFVEMPLGNWFAMAAKGYTVSFPVYILDLTNGERYLLGYATEAYTYHYKKIFKQYLLRKLKRKYKY